MTARERAHALLDELSDSELDAVIRLLKVRREESDEPEVVDLPGVWQQLPSGAPAAWIAALDDERRER